MSAQIAMPRRYIQRRRTSYQFEDRLYWLMMLMLNVPELLTLWGIDTVFKPYRVISLVLAVLVIRKLPYEPRITRQFSRPLFTALGYATVVTVVFAQAEATANAPLIISVFAIFIATYAPTSRKSLYIGLYAFIASFIVSSYFGMLAFRQSTGFFRFSGLFENPNTFGYGGCFVLILALNRRFPMASTFRWILAVGTAPILILSGSRGTLAAIAGGVASQTWRNPKLFFALAIVAIGVACVSMIAAGQVSHFVARHGVFRRILDTEIVERGAVGRLALIKAGLTVGVEHGFVGIGIGQYRLHHHTRFFREYNAHGDLLQLGTHNIYVTLLTEWGLPAFLCFGVIVVRLLRATESMQFERDVVYGFLGVSLINGIGNDLIGEVHFWIMLGVCVRLIYFAHESNRHSQQVQRRNTRADSESSTRQNPD